MRVRKQDLLDLIFGGNKYIMSTTKELRKKYLKGGICMENLLSNWTELKKRILTSEENGKRYVLNFWEKESIVKPYAKIVYGDTSCNFSITRQFIPLNDSVQYYEINVYMRDLVYGM